MHCAVVAVSQPKSEVSTAQPRGQTESWPQLMGQHDSGDVEYEDDGFIIQDDGLLEVDSDEYDAVIEEELSKFHQQQADKYAQLQAISPWVAVPLASPDPITQHLRVEEHQQQALLQDENGCEEERSEYNPPPRPPALQQHVERPFTATEYSPIAQDRPISAASPSSSLSGASDPVSAVQHGLTAVESDASSGMLLDGNTEPIAHHLSSLSSEHAADFQQHEDGAAAAAEDPAGPAPPAEDYMVGEYEYSTEKPDDSPSPAATAYDVESDTNKAAGAAAIAAGFCEQQSSTELLDTDASDRSAVYISEQEAAVLQEGPAAAARDDLALEDGAASMDELPAVVDSAMADVDPAKSEPEAQTRPAEHAVTTHFLQSGPELQILPAEHATAELSAKSTGEFFLDTEQDCSVDTAVSREAAYLEHFELHAAGSMQQQEAAGDLKATSVSGAYDASEMPAATGQPRDIAASQPDEPAPVIDPVTDVQPPAEAAEEPAGAVSSAAAVGGAAYTEPSPAAAAVAEQDSQHGEQQEWAAVSESSEGSAACQAAIEHQSSINLQPGLQLHAGEHAPGDSELLPPHLSTSESGSGAHLAEQDAQLCDPEASADLQEQQLQRGSETSEQQLLLPQWEEQHHQQTQPDEGYQPASDAALPLLQPQQAEGPPPPEDQLQQLSEQQEQSYAEQDLSVSGSQQSANEEQVLDQWGAGEQQEACQQQASGRDTLLIQSDLTQELLKVEQQQQEAEYVMPSASGFEQQTPRPHTDAGDWMVLPGQGHIGQAQQYHGGTQPAEQARDWEQQQESADQLKPHAAVTPPAEFDEPEQHEQQHQQLDGDYKELQGVGLLLEQQYDAHQLDQQLTLPSDTSAAVTEPGQQHDEQQSAVGQDHEAAAATQIAQTDLLLPSVQQYGVEQQEESQHPAAYQEQQQAGEQQAEDLTSVQQQQEDEESDNVATAGYIRSMHQHETSTDVMGNSTVTPAAFTAAPAALSDAELVLDKGTEDTAADADDGFIYQDEDPRSSNCSSNPDSPTETTAGASMGVRPLPAAGLQHTRVSSSAHGGARVEDTGHEAAVDWYPRFSQRDIGREHIISWPDGAAISHATAAAGAARSPPLSPQPPPHAPHYGSRPVHGKTRPAVGSLSPDMMARYEGQLFAVTAAPVAGRLRPESAPARRVLSPTKRHNSPMTQIRGLTLTEGCTKPAWVTGGACAAQQQLAQAVHVYGQQAATWGIIVNSGLQLPSRPHTSHGYVSSGRSTSIGRNAGWTRPAGVAAARPGSHAWDPDGLVPTAEADNSSSGKHLLRPVSADRASRAREGQLSARQQQHWQDGRLQQQQRCTSRSAVTTSRSTTPRQCYDEINSLSQAYGFRPRASDAADGVCSSNWQQQRGQNTSRPGTTPWDNSPVPLNTPNSVPIAAATQSCDLLLAAKAGNGKFAGHSALCSTAAGHSALLARPRTAGSVEAGSILREHPGLSPRGGRRSPSSLSLGSDVYLADLLQKIRQANNSCRKLGFGKLYRLGKGSSATWQQQQIVIEIWGLTEDQEAQQQQVYSWQLKGCLTLQQFNKQRENLAAKVLESEAAAAVAGAQEVLVVDSASGSSGSSPDWVRPDTQAAAAVAAPTVKQAWPAATGNASGTVHRSQSGVRPQSARPSSARRGSGGRQQQEQALLGSNGVWQESVPISWGSVRHGA